VEVDERLEAGELGPAAVEGEGGRVPRGGDRQDLGVDYPALGAGAGQGRTQIWMYIA
jgi:hypothetical protein